MGILDKLLRRPLTPESTETEARACCGHGALAPRWDALDDMGQEERAAGYRCDNCGEEFTPLQASWLRRHALDRLRDVGEPPSSN